MQKYLIVGLGNKGEKYLQTRHNIGFLIADELAKSLDVAFEYKNFGSLAQAKYKGNQLLILKPDTYMNLSGDAISFWKNKEKIETENILVVTDDLNLPFGTLRIKSKGSHGGHNGLKSIEDKLQNTNYPRLRLGIGNGFSKGEQVDFVLGDWGDEEKEKLAKIISKSKEAVLSYCFNGINHAMNNYNGLVE